MAGILTEYRGPRSRRWNWRRMRRAWGRWTYWTIPSRGVAFQTWEWDAAHGAHGTDTARAARNAV